MSEEGVLKSAILLMSIGEEEAAEVLKYLGPKEVQKIGMAMAKLDNVTREQIQVSLREFRADAEEHTTLGMGNDGYIRSVLTKALGNDKAAGLIDRILQGGDTSGI
ncbi:MAG TPA: flagellar motor switch protein FliG, partial [Paracoccaceae bacterium]|nr:flagellar motor switch protein FliG [Paracoccaceae bacterium]